MAAPAGTTGGTGPTPPVDGAAAPEKPDPRRKRPEGMAMTDFLMQIGRENRLLPQDENRRYVANLNNQIDEALQLGDIFQEGNTDVIVQEKVELLGLGGYPIYQFLGTVGYDRLLFTEDPAVADTVRGRPPQIDHQPGQVHSGIEHALWAGIVMTMQGKG